MIDYAIAEGKKSFFTDVVPTHLRNPISFLCLIIHVSLQTLIFLWTLKKPEITLSLYFLLELFKFRYVTLLQLYSLLLTVLILKLENPGRVIIICNEKERLDDEVRPILFTSLRINSIIMFSLAVKIVILQIITSLLDSLPSLSFLLTTCGIRKSGFPNRSLLIASFQIT